MSETHVVWEEEVVPVERARLPALSEGALYGFGCFETMAWREGCIRFLDEHLARLRKAAQALGLTIPEKFRKLPEWAQELGARNECTRGIARLSLHKDGTATRFLFRVFPSPHTGDPAPWNLQRSDFPHPGASPVSPHKHNNYLLNLLALESARSEDCNEALLCRNGEVVEGAISNFYAVFGDTLLTPPLASGALPGIVRERILHTAEITGLDVREAVIPEKDLANAKGAFISNASLLLHPISRIGTIDYPVQPLETIRREIIRQILA